MTAVSPTWLVFVGLAAFALLVDLVFHGKNREMGLLEASLWSLFYIGIAAAFAVYLFVFEAPAAASLFATGYVLEEMLSVDNLFVFAALFTTFSVPHEHRHKILLYGILGAILFRGIFVVIGTAFLNIFGGAIEAVFAVVIMITAWRLMDDEEGNAASPDSWYIKYPQKLFPVTHETSGSRLFLHGKATPLFICLVAIELADVMFAFDSVPAVIAVTKEPLLIYSSIMFAVMGLRATYFVLDALRSYLHYLEKAVIGILMFIAIKLFLSAFGEHIDPNLSLIIILGMMGMAVAGSIWRLAAR